MFGIILKVVSIYDKIYAEKKNLTLTTQERDNKKVPVRATAINVYFYFRLFFTFFFESFFDLYVIENDCFIRKF